MTTQAMPAYVIDYLGAADSEEDIVVTDISRNEASDNDKQQLEKWKQKLRIELIREQYESQSKEKTSPKSILHQLLKL